MPQWLLIVLACWGPLNEIIANVPQLKSNSIVHAIVSVLNAIIGALKAPAEQK